MKKAVVIFIVAALLSVGLIGCGKKVQHIDNSVGPSKQASDVKKDLSTEVGEYVGQIDNNSIEVKVEGTPKAFRLGDGIRDQFANYNYKKGDMIKLYFWLNEYNQPVIEKIEK